MSFGRIRDMSRGTEIADGFFFFFEKSFRFKRSVEKSYHKLLTHVGQVE